MALERGSRLGPYSVTAKIGEGGRGEVYQATDTKLNRQVALKILPEAFTDDPNRLARFQREAQVLASLNHPGIAAIYGLEETGDTRALVLELVKGQTLADRIAQGRLSTLTSPLAADARSCSFPCRRIRQALATVLLSLSISVAGCQDSPAAPPAFDRIVFITIDTLRADHLAEFGYPIDTAPFLTSLSTRGVTFRYAFAHSATTGPSHASLFTSLYPFQHGVQNNGQKLDESFVTLAELLSDRGFSTAAFVSGNALFGSSQIAQGFTHYDQPPLKEMRDGQGRPTVYRPADRTTGTVLDWLEKQPVDEPFFLWVHYYDPHMPLNPPDATSSRLLHQLMQLWTSSGLFGSSSTTLISAARTHLTS